MLTLKPSGLGQANDYDVLDPNRHSIGRIMWTHAAPSDRRWFWSLFRGHGPQPPTDKGYAATREEAMADFRSARVFEVEGGLHRTKGVGRYAREQR